MDKVAAQILELFKHIVRDILAYLIGGLLLIGDFLVISNIYFSTDDLYNKISQIEYLPVLIILLSYGLGQLIMGVMYLVIEFTGVEGRIKKFHNFSATSKLEDEVYLFVNNKDSYDFFVERYNHLAYLRWGLSGANLIVFIVNFSFMIFFHDFDSIIMIISIVAFMLFAIFLLLHYKTENDFNERINALIKITSKLGKANDSPLETTEAV